ncbi:MAG: SRPBCC domain-containing protein [Flavobacterium sp.]
MKNKDFTTSIEVPQSPQQVFKAICEVPNWWNKEDFRGSSTNLGDEFVIDHPGQHFSNQKVVEMIPNEKIVWLVTESHMDWLKENKQEWTNTKMIFEISSKDDRTLLHFTHEGLVPQTECYIMCEQGWNMIIGSWLYHYITTGIPSAQMAGASEIRNAMLEENDKLNGNDFHLSLLVESTPLNAFDKINQVDKWWAKNIMGSTQHLNDKFTVDFGETYVDFEITELIPGQKIAWDVTDCNLHWIDNKKEWIDTRVVFELSQENDKTRINFKHKGLTPKSECFEDCKVGWTEHVTESLVHLIETGQGEPQ